MSTPGIPTGTVTFTITGGPTLSSTLNAAGQASVGISSLDAGDHTITATYGGDAAFSGSSSVPLIQTVTKAATTTTLTATPGSAAFIPPTIQAAPGDSAGPSTTGPPPDRATAPADTQATASAATTVTTTTLTSAPNPSVFGEVVIFTATVEAVARRLRDVTVLAVFSSSDSQNAWAKLAGGTNSPSPLFGTPFDMDGEWLRIEMLSTDGVTNSSRILVLSEQAGTVEVETRDSGGGEQIFKIWKPASA